MFGAPLLLKYTWTTCVCGICIIISHNQQAPWELPLVFVYLFLSTIRLVKSSVLHFQISRQIPFHMNLFLVHTITVQNTYISNMFGLMHTPWKKKPKWSPWLVIFINKVFTDLGQRVNNRHVNTMLLPFLGMITHSSSLRRLKMLPYVQEQ